MNTLKYCDKIYLMDNGGKRLGPYNKFNENTEKIIVTSPLELSKFLGKKLIITGEWCNENLNNQVEKRNIR